MRQEKFEDSYLYKLWHSSEHVLAQALVELYPGKIKLAVAHIDEDGFANDAHWDFAPTQEDLAKIEKKMAEIVKRDLPIKRVEVSYEEAEKLFKDNPFKLEWLNDIKGKDKQATLYWTGDQYVDLCKGPHVDKTGEIKAFKLLSIGGAYWRADEKNEMLTRIYGISYSSQEELDQHLKRLDEAKLRDHRRLGKELDLFTFSELVGSGFPLYTPRGALVRRLLNEYVESLQSAEGYMQVWTPQVAKADLFKTSGHYDKYREDMFRVVSNYSKEEMYLKPMNCPQHTQIYASKPRSYRDLPIRMTDFAMLYRDEKPGELNGLARVRSFSQDDCHIFCREDQVDEEVDRALTMTKKILGTFGFSYKYRLSTRDPEHHEKYLGDPKIWDKVEAWAVEIMKRNEIPYFDGPGEAAFYAPKMDLIATDALGREWQLSTVQIDYVMPERFNLTYINQEGKESRPIMLHRAIIGSAERFMMILLEHYTGNFPAWLHPEQVVIIPIGEEQKEYAKQIAEKMKAEIPGLRLSIDEDSNTLGKRILVAQQQKVPYMVILGKQEVANNSVSLRLRTGENLNGLAVDEVITRIKDVIATKSVTL